MPEDGPLYRRARDVAAGAGEAGDHSSFHRLADGRHDDGYRRGGTLGSERGGGPPRNDNVYIPTNHFGCELRKSVEATFARTIVDENVLTLDIAQLPGLVSIGGRIGGLFTPTINDQAISPSRCIAGR